MGIPSDSKSPSQEEQLDKDLREKMRRAIRIARNACGDEGMTIDNTTVAILATEIFRKLNSL